jgi:hypothetical protein
MKDNKKDKRSDRGVKGSDSSHSKGKNDLSSLQDQNNSLQMLNNRLNTELKQANEREKEFLNLLKNTTEFGKHAIDMDRAVKAANALMDEQPKFVSDPYGGRHESER